MMKDGGREVQIRWRWGPHSQQPTLCCKSVAAEEPQLNAWPLSFSFSHSHSHLYLLLHVARGLIFPVGAFSTLPFPSFTEFIILLAFAFAFTY